MKKILLALLLAPVALADWLPPPAFDCGDAVITIGNSGCLYDPPPPPVYRVARHGRNVSRLGDVSVSTSDVGPMTYAFGSIYVARSNGDATTIGQLDAFGAFHPLLQLDRPVTVLTPAGGDLLAAVYDRVGPEIWRINAGGEIKTRSRLPNGDNGGVYAMDLASDQCTLFLTKGTNIERYDLCNNRSLPRFASLYVTALRILPDGGVISANDSELIRFDAAGNRIATFKLPHRIGPITLDSNPSVAWVVLQAECFLLPEPNGQLVQVNLNIGSILGSAEISLPFGYSLAVQGEWHASIDKVAPPRRRAAGR